MCSVMRKTRNHNAQFCGLLTGTDRGGECRGQVTRKVSAKRPRVPGKRLKSKPQLVWHGPGSWGRLLLDSCCFLKRVTGRFCAECEARWTVSTCGKRFVRTSDDFCYDWSSVPAHVSSLFLPQASHLQSDPTVASLNL